MLKRIINAYIFPFLHIQYLQNRDTLQLRSHVFSKFLFPTICLPINRIQWADYKLFLFSLTSFTMPFLPSFLISEYLVGGRFSKSCYTIMRPIKSNFNSYYFKYFDSFYIPFYSKHTHCTGVMVMAFPAPLSFVCSHICIFK